MNAKALTAEKPACIVVYTYTDSSTASMQVRTVAMAVQMERSDTPDDSLQSWVIYDEHDREVERWDRDGVDTVGGDEHGKSEVTK